MGRVSADSKTRQDFGIMQKDISDDQTKRVLKQIRDNPEL
jgi:hypothetical protein